MGISEHLRGNVVGYIALFFAMTGSAVALQGKNTVDSGDIKKGQVKASDLAASSVSSPTVVDDSLTGADINESTLTLPASGASGAAGGDLTGTYPNPEIGAGAVGATEVAGGSLGTAQITDDSLSGADVNESTLFNDNSLNTADINESTLFNDNSLTGADIDESTLSSVPAANTVNGTTTAVVNAHIAANGSQVLFGNSLEPLNGACSAGGEATMTVDNFANAQIALYVDNGAADPVFSTVAINGTSAAQSASTNDLQIWHVANATGSLTNQTTYVIGIDESGADCDFYVRAIAQNQF